MNKPVMEILIANREKNHHENADITNVVRLSGELCVFVAIYPIQL